MQILAKIKQLINTSLTVGQTGGSSLIVDSLVSILFTWISPQQTLSSRWEESAVICKSTLFADQKFEINNYLISPFQSRHFGWACKTDRWSCAGLGTNISFQPDECCRRHRLCPGVGKMSNKLSMIWWDDLLITWDPPHRTLWAQSSHKSLSGLSLLPLWAHLRSSLPPRSGTWGHQAPWMEDFCCLHINTQHTCHVLTESLFSGPEVLHRPPHPQILWRRRFSILQDQRWPAVWEVEGERGLGNTFGWTCCGWDTFEPWRWRKGHFRIRVSTWWTDAGPRAGTRARKSSTSPCCLLVRNHENGARSSAAGSITCDWLMTLAHVGQWRNLLMSGSATSLNTCCTSAR